MNWQMLRVNDTDDCDGRKFSALIRAVADAGNLAHAIVSGVSWADGELIENPSNSLVTDVVSLIHAISHRVQFVWVDVFCFSDRPSLCDWNSIPTFVDQVRSCNCLIQACDNSYFFVITADASLIETAKQLFSDYALIEGDLDSFAFMF